MELGDCEQLRDIQVSRRSKQAAGHCNVCTDSGAYRTVTEFTLRGWSGRLCDKCKAELIRQLKAV